MQMTNAVRTKTTSEMPIRYILAGAIAFLVCLVCSPNIALAGQGSLQAAPLSSLEAQSQSGSGEYFSNSNFVIFFEDGQVGIVEYIGTAKTVSIPASANLHGKSYPIVQIFEGAFADTAIRSVSVPSSVISIDQGAFAGCKSLTKVTGCKGLRHIGKKAFYGCSKLSEFPFGKKLELIESKAFSGSKVKTSQYPSSLVNDGSGNFCSGLSILRVRGEESYTDAYKVLALVNKERKKEGLPALTMDKDLMKAAMQRAAEISVVFDHTRPDGTPCETVCEQKMFGENIAAGQRSAAMVMGSWMNSPGHRANILLKDYKSIGIGCFEVNGYRYWVQAFGYWKADKATKLEDRTVTHTVICENRSKG